MKLDTLESYIDVMMDARCCVCSRKTKPFKSRYEYVYGIYVIYSKCISINCDNLNVYQIPEYEVLQFQKFDIEEMKELRAMKAHRELLENSKINGFLKEERDNLEKLYNITKKELDKSDSLNVRLKLCIVISLICNIIFITRILST